MKTKINLTLKVLLVFLIMFSFYSCADVVNVDVKSFTIIEPYGFWGGLWHGIISPISFIASLFSDNIAMYGINNTGGWYDFGFILGTGSLIGGGIKLT